MSVLACYLAPSTSQLSSDAMSVPMGCACCHSHQWNFSGQTLIVPVVIVTTPGVWLWKRAMMLIPSQAHPFPDTWSYGWRL
jgi:hypothetical protein